MPQTKLNEVFIRHQIFLQRHGSSIWKEAREQLTDIEEYVLELLDKEDLTPFALGRITNIEESIREIIENSNLTRDQITKFEDLAVYEQDFFARVIDEVTDFAVDRVETGHLISSLKRQPMNLVSGKQRQVRTLGDMYEKLTETMAKNVSTQITSGISTGDSTGKIIADVRKLAYGKSRREVEAVVRTATNHVSNTTRKELAENNDWMFDGYKFLATLDARTTIICAGLDGKVLSADTNQIPPLHYNCRSTIVPKVKDEFSIGLEGGKRASKFGPVDAQLTYDGFLRRQSKAFQEEVLGKERARLFRAGMPIKSFTNDSGIVYTLEELKNKDRLSLK